MIPILYPRLETDFADNGLGGLPDAISCKVDEEINGVYELSMEYPDDGLHADDLVEGNIIMATHDGTGDLQPFRVFRRTQLIDGKFVINARHLSYDLSRIPIMPFTATGLLYVMEAIGNNAAVQTQFEFSTGFYDDKTFTLEVPQSAKAVLGGGEGSVLDVHGGELWYDKWLVHLRPRRGEDKDLTISYGVNMTGFEAVFERQEGYYQIVPFYRKQDTLIVCDPPIVEWRTAYPHLTGAMVVDLTDHFEQEPTAAELQTAAGEWLVKNNPWIVETAINISFVELEKTEDYKDIARIQELELGDGILVRHAKMAPGLDWNAPWFDWEAPFRMTRAVYDVLRERYTDVTLGREIETLSSLIEKQNRKFQKTTNAVNWRHA